MPTLVRNVAPVVLEETIGDENVIGDSAVPITPEPLVSAREVPAVIEPAPIVIVPVVVALRSIVPVALSVDCTEIEPPLRPVRLRLVTLTVPPVVILPTFADPKPARRLNV